MKKTYYWILMTYICVMVFGLTIGALSYIAKMTDLWIMCWGICGLATLVMVNLNRYYNATEEEYYED